MMTMIHPGTFMETVRYYTEQQNPLVLICTLGTCLVFFVSIVRCLSGRKSDNQASHHHLRDRADTGFTQSTAPSRPGLSTDQQQPNHQGQHQPHMYWNEPSYESSFTGTGPKVVSIRYETWTPPTSWKNASKQLLPSNTKMKAHVVLELDLKKGNLQITNKLAVDLSLVQVHVQNSQGAVLELVTGMTEASSPKSEYTFQSSHSAAQFQYDVNAYQSMGRAIMDQFDVLEMIHRGSTAHEGKESVLHDSAGDDSEVDSGVAWDDVFRCLGDALPMVAKNWDTFIIPEDETLMDTLPLLYRNKRALMGREDFFRLFCPILPPNSIPRVDSSPSRLRELIQLRKLVSKTALFVQSYYKAKCVANCGWKLEWDLDAQPRLAFDETVENTKHDISVKNEYWEARVSRDVVCNVHGKQHAQQPGSSIPSALQAYTLVGSHTFRLAAHADHNSYFDQYWLMAHDKDPLESIPSLRQIVERNPELHFFVASFFVAGVATIQLFVRTLPIGADRAFDKVMDNFIKGTVELRKQKLELFLQLSPESRLSPLIWAGINAVSLLLRWSRKGEQQIPTHASRKCTVFPGMTLDRYFETHHFGGRVQTKMGMPTNYVAASVLVNASRMSNFLFAGLYHQLEKGALASSIVDLTFVLEGQEIEELPERALGTIRLVHCDPAKQSLPFELSAQAQPLDDVLPDLLGSPRQPRHLFPPMSPVIVQAVEETGRVMQYVGNVAVAPFVHPASPVACERYPLHDEPEDSFRDAIDDSFVLSLPSDEVNLRAGIDALREVLVDITIPVRRENLTTSQWVRAEEISNEEELSALPSRFQKEGSIVKVRVLNVMNRYDLRRYYLAANCDVKKAAKNVVESALWRGVTFPIDIRTCRIELQSGQCFQQGEDYDGNAIFYFRNLLPGPWKKDPQAVLNAVLHRLETGLKRLTTRRPNVKITFIVLMGKPKFRKKKKRKHESKADDGTEAQTRLTMFTGDDNEGVEMELDDDEGDNVPPGVNEEDLRDDPYKMGINPRLQTDTDYFEHVNFELILQLIQVVMKHYPERLYKAIIAPGKKRGYGRFGTAVGVQMALRKHIASPRTRTKCFILHRIGELKDFVAPSELITIAGGQAPLHKKVFDCR